MALRAFTLFAAVFVRNLDLMSTALAVKLDNGRLFRHDHDASALWAFAFFARVFLINGDNPVAAWTGETNHDLPFPAFLFIYHS